MALLLLLLMMMITFAVWQTVLPYLFTSSNTCAPLKVKLSYYRLGQVNSIHQSCGFPNFWTIRTWRSESCQPYAVAAFTSQEISHVLISVTGLVNPRTTLQPEELSEWHRNDPIGNQTCNLPACSASPLSIAPLCTALCSYTYPIMGANSSTTTDWHTDL